MARKSLLKPTGARWGWVLLRDVEQDRVVYVLRLIVASEHDLVVRSARSRDQDLAGAVEVPHPTLVAQDTYRSDPRIRQRQHRNLLADVGLVLDDDAPVGQGKEPRGRALGVVDGKQLLTGHQAALDLLQLVLSIEHHFSGGTDFGCGFHAHSPYSGFRSSVIRATVSASRRHKALIDCGPGFGGHGRPSGRWSPCG